MWQKAKSEQTVSQDSGEISDDGNNSLSEEAEIFFGSEKDWPA